MRRDTEEGPSLDSFIFRVIDKLRFGKPDLSRI